MHQTEFRQVHCLVVTISDTRTVETDKSGSYICLELEKSGHSVVKHIIVPDEESEIKNVLRTVIEDERVEAVLMTGGTGISKKDITIEVMEKYINKKLPGFGELFRVLSYTEDIGSAAMMSRASAGIMDKDKIVFSMPGSSGAVKLAMQKLILPELSHIYHELHKHISD